MLTGVDQSAGTENSVFIDQCRERQFGYLHGHAQLLGQYVGPRFQIAFPQPFTVFLFVPVTGKNDFQPVGLAFSHGGENGDQCFADRTGRGEKKEQGAFPVAVIAAYPNGAAVECFEIKNRYFFAGFQATSGHQGACRRDTFMQNSDLADQCEHHDRQDQDQNPQQRVGNGKCRFHGSGIPGQDSLAIIRSRITNF